MEREAGSTPEPELLLHSPPPPLHAISSHSHNPHYSRQTQHRLQHPNLRKPLRASHTGTKNSTHLALARPGLQTTTCPYHKLIPLTASRDTHLSPHPAATGQICPSTTHTHPSVPHSQQPDYVQLPQSPTMPRTPHHQPQPNHQVIPVGRTTFDLPPSWVFSGLHYPGKRPWRHFPPI